MRDAASWPYLSNEGDSLGVLTGHGDLERNCLLTERKTVKGLATYLHLATTSQSLKMRRCLSLFPGPWVSTTGL